MTERKELSLDGQWLFQIDRAEKPYARDWHKPGYQAEGWWEVPVPGSWDTYRPELLGYSGHGWFRRTFRLDPAWNGSRIHLRFEAANYETAVWVNGREAGIHRGGFDPFEFDVTDLLNWDDENTLAVRVDNCGRVGRLPHSIVGWWNYGGIYRSVKLLALPPVRVEDIFVRAEPEKDGGAAPLQVDVILANESDVEVTVSLTGAVIAEEREIELGEELESPAVVLAPGSRVPLSLSSSIIQARLWSPDTPHLYTLRVAVVGGEQALDTVDVRFGVRRFEVRGTKLYLNGEPIYLRGFNRHEEYGGTGRVDPGGVLEADMKLMKDLNSNMVRMHYQLHPDLYELADEMGLLVFAEIPLFFIGQRDFDRGGLGDPEVREQAEAMLRTSIGELKNHPAVVIWSVGNECATADDTAHELISHLVEVARSLDDTRPVTYVSNMGLRERSFDLVDIQCINVYKGLRSVELGEFVEKIHAMEPEKPLLITEFGMQSVQGLHGGNWCSEELHARILESNREVFRARQDFIPGALIWCLADYRIFTIAPQAGDGHLLNKWRMCHGILSLDRRPKEAVVAAARRMFGRVV